MALDIMWFTRRKPKGASPTSLELETGPRPSPGFELVMKMLSSLESPAVLDLGNSSTENVRFLSEHAADVTLHDLFRTANGETGQRSTPFRFDLSVADLLPEGDRIFDLILLWDLIHYFDRETFELFGLRLSELCRPGALVFLLAANHAPLPWQPIHFRIEEVDTLHYMVPPGDLAESPRLSTREVESRMNFFSPLRLFQLRNGLQEFLFRYEAEENGGGTSP